MGEILGLGMTHGPQFVVPDDHMVDQFRRALKRDTVPPEMRESSNWPTPMQEEWSTDDALAAARRHREAMVPAFRQLRAELDAFQPDFVLIWGDDQYENFREDGVPAFCIYIYDEIDCLPYRRSGIFDTAENVWGQPEDKRVPVRGHREAANYLARSLLRNDFDIAFAYKPHHHPTLAHAFTHTISYLDYDQRGFPYPVIPFHVNCYGSELVRSRGGAADGEQSPPPPSPRRCYDIGCQVAEAIASSPWRAAVVGSSSWSHASLTRKHHRLYPDIEADRQRLAELKAGRQGEWRNLTLEAVTDAGQHEFLNWLCLAGAMGSRQGEVLAWAETYIFNSDKCAAVFRP